MRAGVPGGEVEAAFGVGKDTEVGYLAGKIGGICRCIAVGDADEDDKTGVYGGDALPGDGHGGAGDSLKEGAHR